MKSVSSNPTIEAGGANGSPLRQESLPMGHSLKKISTITAIAFLKAPRKGTIKTRLAKTIGEEKALDAYRKMAERQLIEIPSNWATEIYFTPRDALTEMQAWLGKQHTFRPQAEGDLGARLSAAVKTHFEDSESQLFLLGADCPWLNHEIFELAVKGLESSDMVVGPTYDGGYYLLGIKNWHRTLFENISWSTDLVLTQTLEKADTLNLSVEKLPEMHDVDTSTEWELARKQFSGLDSK
ncbi:TIGR04282 family arsenosugar biosynthesis glycosyltransferase [Puniceicoccaceae bacterium K14]|nr:TIGR04282 family arsenosugar biosynthesis glycosyltransferase [Puniceicoccaceae bacterium K14]